MRALAILTLLTTVACEQEAGFHDGGSQTQEITEGAMTVSTNRVIISAIGVGFTKSESFTVSSVGKDSLSIYDAVLVANPGAVFVFDERKDDDILTGESQDWAVAATLAEAGMAEGAIRIESNDPTTPTFFVTVCAVTEDWPEPCPAEAPGSDTGDTGGADTGAGDTGDTGV